MSKWISVDDRLPNENQEVLCYLNDGNMLVSYFCMLQFERGVEWYYPDSWVNIDSENFTHWMPLPEPPK